MTRKYLYNERPGHWVLHLADDDGHALCNSGWPVSGQGGWVPITEERRQKIQLPICRKCEGVAAANAKRPTPQPEYSEELEKLRRWNEAVRE